MLCAMSADVQPLPPELFLHTFSLVPRAAICLLVRDGIGGVLLARRAAGMSMAGAWHLPGAFVLRGESLAACAERVARKELGRAIVESRPMGFFEDLDGDPRGHVIDLVLEVELDGPPHATEETDEVRFFGAVPEGLGFHHDRVLLAAGLPPVPLPS